MTMDPLSRIHTSSAVRRFAVQTGLVLVIAATATVIGLYLRTEQLVMLGVRQQAESFLDLVVATRNWNADHGGLWVVQGEHAQTNPYLLKLGVDPETSTPSGTGLTLRNPAIMTRELSEALSDEGNVQFRLTSLKPVNPQNRPDEWETMELRAFERGAKEADDTVTRESGRAYRLMRPLITESGCIRCHGGQGYRVGDVRGALSVQIDLSAVDEQLRGNAISLAFLWLGVVGALGFILFALVFRMASRLEKGEAKLKALATTDELTGIANRRTTMERLDAELERSRREGSEFGVIELDIDHFKNVNDTFGHAAGDEVLRSMARVMRDHVRAYDTIGRIGGEEFLVVAPDIDEAGLKALAERIRHGVVGCPIEIEPNQCIHVTVSAGYAVIRGESETARELLQRADTALYTAKEKGRDRVERG